MDGGAENNDGSRYFASREKLRFELGEKRKTPGWCFSVALGASHGWDAKITTEVVILRAVRSFASNLARSEKHPDGVFQQPARAIPLIM